MGRKIGRGTSRKLERREMSQSRKKREKTATELLSARCVHLT